MQRITWISGQDGRLHRTRVLQSKDPHDSGANAPRPIADGSQERELTLRAVGSFFISKARLRSLSLTREAGVSIKPGA